MLSTKNLVNNYKEVPETWIFEHYCQLSDKLSGQDIKINSIFNSHDKTPSMCIFMDKEKKVYRFKDFSSGVGGSAIDLVMELKKVSFSLAVNTIEDDYNDYILHNTGYTVEAFKEHSKFRVTAHTTRKWNTKDQQFWTPFNIGTRLLEDHNVSPLSSYVMSKVEDGEVKTITISGEHLYGYFTKAGELYKIYQPKNKEKKFIKVKTHIQGIDQLKGYDYLIVQSSLKDILSTKSLKLHIDYVAPDSENTMIPEKMMIKWLEEYKQVLVMFDNDEAGIKAMKKYREKYNTPAILLTMSKDISDSIKDHTPGMVKERLVPLIDNKLCILES